MFLLPVCCLPGKYFCALRWWQTIYEHSSSTQLVELYKSGSNLCRVQISERKWAHRKGIECMREVRRCSTFKIFCCVLKGCFLVCMCAFVMSSQSEIVILTGLLPPTAPSHNRLRAYQIPFSSVIQEGYILGIESTASSNSAQCWQRK